MHLTFGGSCGKLLLIANVNLKTPPLYIPVVHPSSVSQRNATQRHHTESFVPSSGSIFNSKLRMSSGSGKCVRIVGGNDSSATSIPPPQSAPSPTTAKDEDAKRTLLSPQLCSGDFLLLPAFGVVSSLLLLLLFLGVSSANDSRDAGRPRRGGGEREEVGRRGQTIDQIFNMILGCREGVVGEWRGGGCGGGDKTLYILSAGLEAW